MKKGGAAPMVGGQGRYGYFHNSSFQKNGFLAVKDMVRKAIVDKFDVPVHGGTIRIADLGCSVGPNTFYTMQTIVDAVLLKLKKLTCCDQVDGVEFQGFFNDQFRNDFNLLLNSIPSDQTYCVAAVPGSFYSRLFPRASIHCFNSSMSLHWLSKPPDGVANKGRILYFGGGPDILNAYIAQFRLDMMAFLSGRAEELVTGGLLILQFLCRPKCMAPDAARYDIVISFVEPILREFVMEGKVKEEELDSFQMPLFAPSIEEFKEVVEMNGCFTIHVAEHVNQGWGLKGGGDEGTEADLEQLAQSMSINSRAICEKMLSDHFGTDILDELFQRFPNKVYQHFSALIPSIPSPPPTAFFVLQKKPHSPA
ncbi:farnesoic acid carboxyl-O-methyltransferase-like [Nymphaea colorata]|nr:farnesoic acid carboxyl-O-methyltransferase-like [Nymphaea colorata]